MTSVSSITARALDLSRSSNEEQRLAGSLLSTLIDPPSRSFLIHALATNSPTDAPENAHDVGSKPRTDLSPTPVVNAERPDWFRRGKRGRKKRETRRRTENVGDRPRIRRLLRSASGALSRFSALTDGLARPCCSPAVDYTPFSRSLDRPRAFPTTSNGIVAATTFRVVHTSYCPLRPTRLGSRSRVA